MTEILTHRKATITDLRTIVALLIDDELGQTREVVGSDVADSYVQAFGCIDDDPNHYLMLVERGGEAVGTCHLTLTPSLTFQGSLRMAIEAVRVKKELRGQGIGEWMMQQAVDYAKEHGASIIQLTTNKKRPDAKRFYEKLGFQATHEGMKICIEL